MKFFTEEFNLLMTVVGATCCLIPLTLLGPNSKHVIRDLSDVGKNTDRHPISLGFLFVVIIPFTDLLLNVPSHIASFLSPVKTCSKRSSETKSIVRLTDFERFLFLLGMAIQSSMWFLPSSTDIRTLGAVSICVWNCHHILLLGPILVFLQRCTTTFTGCRTSFILFTGCLSLAISSTFNVLAMDINFTAAHITSDIFGLLSGAGYGLLTITCSVKYFFDLAGTPSKRRSLITWLEIHTYKRRVADAVMPSTTDSDSDSELYTNYVPALHMISSAMLAAAATHKRFTTMSPGSSLTSAIICLLAQILVLVVELRIRKNEITRGLVR